MHANVAVGSFYKLALCCFCSFTFFLLHCCEKKHSAYEEKNALLGTEEGAVFFFGTITAPGTWPFRQTSWTTTGGEKMDAGWDTFSPSLDPRLLPLDFQLLESRMDGIGFRLARENQRALCSRLHGVLSWPQLLIKLLCSTVYILGSQSAGVKRSRREAEFVQECKFNRKSWSSWIQMQAILSLPSVQF